MSEGKSKNRDSIERLLVIIFIGALAVFDKCSRFIDVHPVVVTVYIATLSIYLIIKFVSLFFTIKLLEIKQGDSR